MVDVEPERPGPREGPRGPKRGFGLQHLSFFLSSSQSLQGWAGGLSMGAQGLWDQPLAVSMMARPPGAAA